MCSTAGGCNIGLCTCSAPVYACDPNQGVCIAGLCSGQCGITVGGILIIVGGILLGVCILIACCRSVCRSNKTTILVVGQQGAGGGEKVSLLASPSPQQMQQQQPQMFAQPQPQYAPPTRLVPNAFCGGCGAPLSGGAFCASCGAKVMA
jgi:hypothetical protein